METDSGLTGSPPGHVSVQIFGNLRVRRGGTVLGAHQLGGSKPRQILGILLLQLGTPVSTDRLIGLLWDGRPPVGALATLEGWVGVLRSHLQPDFDNAGPLRTAHGGYVMERSLVDLDLDRFDALIRRAQGAAPPDSFVLLRQALTLATAPLLGDELLPEWAERERTRHALRIAATRILAVAPVLFSVDETVGWSSQAPAGEPLTERPWNALNLALAHAGLHPAGLQSHEHYRATNRELLHAMGQVLRAAYARQSHATLDRGSELRDVLSALLILHQHISRIADDSAHPTSMPAASTVPNPWGRRAMWSNHSCFTRFGAHGT